MKMDEIMRTHVNRGKKPFRTTVVLTKEHRERIVALAEKSDVSVSWLIRRAIADFLAKHSRDHGVEIPLQQATEKTMQV